jgi:hypothetical protein
MGLNRSLFVGFAIAGLVACGGGSTPGGTGGAPGTGSGGNGSTGSGGSGSTGCVRYPAGDSACGTYSNNTWPQAWNCPTEGTATGKLSVSDCAAVTFGMGPWPLCCTAN